MDGNLRSVKNAVVVDFTVWFLECLWGTAIHSREQCSYVGQLVSTDRNALVQLNHLLSFVAFSFDLKVLMRVCVM